ncbi:MAG: bifunctional UDP-N-acetylglucosamine diphosphorylase/glucosamine-1-phosphate N-acetyltransferase GlmU [Burkholderiaceae bacterium]|jgi:bifunctional UDP-N-acetylglucosamine pyrophosphorylase/glucosamine-1-phosphate N-acetyltransferase|nr:bifunctional UDP-N-acetylglucosamine diphosphorylase/glucosamine-1-phosphate N-acetyltransferase GlmU [Burkholderiaceae bacterium]
MNVVILAAGMGKRMRSDLPKVLHLLAGKPLLSHVLETARKLPSSRLFVVYGYGGEQVPGSLPAADVTFVRQEPQLGTGHAVMQAASRLDNAMPTLVLYGDVPLIATATLQRLVHSAEADKLALLTTHLRDPAGYGRIVREGEKILRVVEEKDASANERAITEVNTGILIAPTVLLKQWLHRLSNRNAQQEYYLTDIVAQASADGISIVSAQPDSEWEVLGVNSKGQLAELERRYQRHLADTLMEAGVSLADPARIDVRGTLQCGRDVYIDVNCVFEGEVVLGDGVSVGPNCYMRDTRVDAQAEIRPFCHIDGAAIGAGALIGPYARLRPGSSLGESVHIGNFVEVKNSHINAYSKANHLAYVGDAVVGSQVNIGAGAITCNYDGANKHQTVIEDGAFIGTNCELVAPVRVGSGATIGAGTTLTKDAPPGSLTISRGKQTTINHWKRPAKKE